MDKFYNDAFAKKVVSIVSKMDDDEAEMFLRFSTYDVLMADIEANRRTLDSHTVEVHKRLQETVAKAASSLVSKSSSVDMKEIAALVGAVSKAKTPYEELYHKEQPRGKGGRWAVSISRDTYKGPKKGQDRTGPNRSAGDVMVGPQFNLTGALATAGQRTTAFQEAWNADDPLYASTNKRTYDRIKAGSDALAYSNDPKMRAAGRIGGFFGQYGPEAEKVVGPHLRRTAYRYRGTEKTPDSELIGMANTNSKAIMRNEETADLTPAMRTKASQGAATNYLLARLPKKKLSGLQQASGKIPPSEGIIINADGKIITQAVGYSDDHYLPFNLKNLKGLQGGHYVRSRSQGGLTTEDIYTGLVSGARSVTVVSRSGVFTVNFEDDFRGARRYNDKAAGMVQRYAKTLDAVKSETVDRRPLSPEERADIRDEVEREAADDGWMTRADIEDRIKEKEREFKTRPSLSKAELEEIEMNAAKDNMDDPRKYRLARAELISAAMDAKAERNYKLDGEGYEVAQEALREQFPYYIASVQSVHRKNAKVDNPFTPEADKGYVKPRYIRPEGAKENYFDESITGRGKVSADRTNYANWAHNPERLKAVSRSERTGDEPKEGSPEAKKAEAFKVREAVEQSKGRRASADALYSLTTTFASALKESNFKDTDIVEAASSREAFDKIVANPTKREKLVRDLRDKHNMLDPDDEAQGTLHRKTKALFTALDAIQSGEAWDGSQHAQRPSKPFSFDTKGGKKAAYGSSASEEQIMHEWSVQARKLAGENAQISPDKFSDEQLKDLAAWQGYMGHALVNGEKDTVTFAAHAADLGADMDRIQHVLPQMGTERGKNLGEQLLDKSEAAHRLRALKLNLDRHKATHAEKMPDSPKVQSSVPPQLSDRREQTMPGASMDTIYQKLREHAGQVSGSPEVASTYNAIARSVKNLREGALEPSQFRTEVEDYLTDSDLPYNAERSIREHLRQLGLDV